MMMTKQCKHLHISQRTSMMPMMFKLIMMYALVQIGSGCPGGEPTTQLEGRCLKIGDRCRIRAGVLGICSPTEGQSSTNPTDSTLICTPQH